MIAEHAGKLIHNNWLSTALYRTQTTHMHVHWPVFTKQCCASAVYDVALCLAVWHSQVTEFQQNK